MKNPFHRKTVRRAISEFAQSLERDLMDSNSELRQLFARIARSEAKNFFALHLGTELEKFERELAARAERALAELGSAAPTLDQHAADAVALLRTCNGCVGPPSYPELNPDCPVHGDPAVLAQLKENL